MLDDVVPNHVLVNIEINYSSLLIQYYRLAKPVHNIELMSYL